MGFMDSIRAAVSSAETAPTSTTTTSTVTKDWKGVTIQGNIYDLGNTDGISGGSSPGIPKILENLKAGKAKLVDAYPYSFVKDGYLATGYSDKPTSPYYLNPETYDYEQPPAQKLLFMDGKLYPFSNDWAIMPVTENVQTGSYINEDGQVQAITEQRPTGAYRIRSRVDNNVFDEAIFKADASGNVTAYSPKIYQTGRNGGGFFGGSALGGFLNDLVSMAQTTAPVWLPAVTAGLTGGAEAALSPEAGALGTASDLAADTTFWNDLGPLADTTAGLDNAFVQDMSQGIETVAPETTSLPSSVDVTPEQAAQIEANNAAMQQTPTAVDAAGQLAPTTPAENPFLAGMETTTAEEGAGVAGAGVPTGTYEGGANYLSGMEETAATEGAGVAGAENPTGAVTSLPSTSLPNLSPSQISSLLKMGAGLFGGVGALAAAKGLTGALGGGTALPTIQAPTPFTGTYSGMNPYDAAYFQQVQQNYNRLFPTAPADVATPLQSWYQTKFTPDTNVSQKLFGV